MKNRAILNIYQLPDETLVKQKNITGWGLKKIMAFARNQLNNKNRLCRLEKRKPEPVKYLHMYARRAGKMKYHKSLWCHYLMKKMWAINNKYSKCLGGE